MPQEPPKAMLNQPQNNYDAAAHLRKLEHKLDALIAYTARLEEAYALIDTKAQQWQTRCEQLESLQNKTCAQLEQTLALLKHSEQNTHA